MGSKVIQGNLDVVGNILQNGSSMSIPVAEVEAILKYGAVPDPILENNSWALIRKVCEAGDAANYWSVGDSKNVVGGDGYTRPLTIVDMQGLYGKHVVFQFRVTSENKYVWEADEEVNDYENSDMVLTHLAVGGDAYTAMVSPDLGAQLTNTTVKVCKGGKDATLVDVTGKLFLPAMKEITTSPASSIVESRTEENAALTTFQYYVTHNAQADRVINMPSTSSGASLWLRSPSSGDTNGVCFVSYDGSLDVYPVYNSRRVAPCIAF